MTRAEGCVRDLKGDSCAVGAFCKCRYCSPYEGLVVMEGAAGDFGSGARFQQDCATIWGEWEENNGSK
jgi:hypothetical protein